MPRIEKRNNARNFPLMLNQSSVVPGSGGDGRTRKATSARTGKVGASGGEERLAGHPFQFKYGMNSVGSYARGGAREVSRERQGNCGISQLSASGCEGTATSATEKRKTGTRRMQNTAPAGISAVNSTTVRQSKASDLREENITLCSENTTTRCGITNRREKIERAVTLVML